MAERLRLKEGAEIVLRKWVAVMVVFAASTAMPAPGAAQSGGGPDGSSPTVEVFAPGAVTVPGQSLYRGSFSPDGAFYFFRKVTAGQEDYRIFVTRLGPEGEWLEAEQVVLGGDYSDLYPSLSPDGSRMVFASYRPTPEGPTSQANLWYAERDGDGWSTPVYMPAPSDREAYNPGPTYRSDGWVYYKREVWGPQSELNHLRTRWTVDGYSPPEQDPTLDPFTGWRDDALIWEGVPNPDGNLMVLTVSLRDPESGRTLPSDLWITSRTEAGWSEPERLPEVVNTSDYETFTLFSLDGHYLYFGRGFTSYHRVAVSELVR